MDALHHEGADLSAAQVAQIEAIIAEWQPRRGRLIMVLHAIQTAFGYIPAAATRLIARHLQIPMARIYEVLTFYHYFKLQQPGRHRIAVCMGTACYLKGAPQVVDELQRMLKVTAGDTTADRHFHLETVRCLGCCGLAPVVTVDGDTHGLQTGDSIGAVVATYEKEGSEKEGSGE